MTLRLDEGQADFGQHFEYLLSLKRETTAEVGRIAEDILADVKERGDAAVMELTKRFDRIDLSQRGIRIEQVDIEKSQNACPPETVKALELAVARITGYHQRQIPKPEKFSDQFGNILGWRWTPLDSVGLYVPGGTAAYPSTVLMNAIPAKVAGVERLVMVVPTPEDKLNPAVMMAAKLAGISEIYRIGGAQAIAALAYGTKTIAPVDKIVGPGNAYVAAAKRLVYGTVGIDMIAGPSEVLIIADETANPTWLAADLLAQAEHDVSAQSILITNSSDLAGQVEAALRRQIEDLTRREIAAKSWHDFGAIIIVKDMDTAPELANRIAAEHLQIITREPEMLATKIKHAGAIFLGEFTPEAIGDYVAGSNHVLPTNRSARFSSGLGVYDFLKRTSVLKCSAQGLAEIGGAAITLAVTEGLQAHARSVSLRLDKSAESSG